MNDQDLYAAYALDALEEDETLAVEAEMAASADVNEEVATYVDAARQLAIATTPEVDAPAALRDRVLTAARAVRAGEPLAPADPRDVRRIEAERFVALLGHLTPEQWQTPVDPPEFAGWTVHDLAVHVFAAESLFAQKLGISDPDVSEQEDSNEGRTDLARARHRALPTDAVIAEFERASAAISDALAAYTLGQLDDVEFGWWGADMRVSTICIHRSFETWIHADDIRRAVGLPATPPPAPSLQAMSSRATSWSNLMLEAGGHSHAPAKAVIDLTGPGGATHVVDLGLEAAPDDADPLFTLRVDIVDYCRAIGSRFPADDLPVVIEGDRDEARVLVSSLASLAGL